MDFTVNASWNADGAAIDFGVLSDINFFEPGKPVRFAVRCTGKRAAGRRAEVLITCNDVGFREKKTVTLSEEGEIGSFTPVLNGLYELTLRPLSLDCTLRFHAAVMPRAKHANSSFLFGCQPYLARFLSGAQQFDGFDREKSLKIMIDTIDYMGFNAYREDSVYWGEMQKGPFADADFSKIDRLLSICREHGAVLHWIFMGSEKWAWPDKYKNDEEKCYCVCPKTDMWCDFVGKFVRHYRGIGKDRMIYEIWNEPDWEFFHGTKEEFAALLEATARTIRENDPDCFSFSGGLSAPLNDETDFKWYKKGAPTLYLTTAKRLMEEGILNTYATHLHYPFTHLFFEFMDHGIGLAEKQSGIVNNGAMNTESGVSSEDDDVQSRDNVAKALWFRSHGWGGFTLFAMTNLGYPDHFAILNDRDPRKSAVSYTVMISMIGQAVSHETICDDRSIFADLYFDGENSIVTLYNDSEPETGVGTLTLPRGRSAKMYDLYGNPIDLSGARIPAEAACKYIVLPGRTAAADFFAETAAIGQE